MALSTETNHFWSRYSREIFGSAATHQPRSQGAGTRRFNSFERAKLAPAPTCGADRGDEGVHDVICVVELHAAEADVDGGRARVQEALQQRGRLVAGRQVVVIHVVHDADVISPVAASKIKSLRRKLFGNRWGVGHTA